MHCIVAHIHVNHHSVGRFSFCLLAKPGCWVPAAGYCSGCVVKRSSCWVIVWVCTGCRRCDCFALCLCLCLFCCCAAAAVAAVAAAAASVSVSLCVCCLCLSGVAGWGAWILSRFWAPAPGPLFSARMQPMTRTPADTSPSVGPAVCAHSARRRPLQKPKQ